MCLPTKTDKSAVSPASGARSVLGIGGAMLLACVGGPVLAGALGGLGAGVLPAWCAACESVAYLRGAAVPVLY